MIMAKSKPGAGKSAGPKAEKAKYLATATDATTSIKDRVVALRRTAPQLCESEKSFDAVLKLLQDVKEPSEVRLAALQSLQAASFGVIAFESCRSDYVVALRSLVADPDPELRQRVLGILAREKDGPTQKKLLIGLENPDKALVPPEKALQLLSYDVHADAYSVARKIVDDPPNETAKREALRLLAADASAAPLFEKLLRNKFESPEIRQVCAAALQGVKPKKYQAYAREMVLDKSEDKDLRAQSLSALTHFGDAEALTEDKALKKQVEQMKADAPEKVKKGARQFLKKYSE
jgi:hypothetical protein